MKVKAGTYSKLAHRILLAVASGAPLILVTDDQIFSPLREQDRYEAVVKAQPSLEGQANLTLLSHRLIQYDEQQGFVTSDIASLARGNTLAFIKKVEEQCDRKTATGFITCANNILGHLFYYKPSNTVADAWANRYSDCDLNSYLLMDVMYRAGFKPSIVYSPGHAFISFIDENGNIYFQETTENNNMGNKADMTDSFYIKTLPGFYYQPQDAAFSEKLYPILTTSKLTEKNGQQLATNMFSMWPNNPLVQDVFYHYRNPLTAADAEQLRSLLATDISSSIKRTTLARYYQQKGDIDEAVSYLEKIDDAMCSDSCLELKADNHVEYKIILFIKKHLREGVTVSMIKNTFVHIIIWYIALILTALILPGTGWWITRLREKAE